jgi:hypothetical protein
VRDRSLRGTPPFVKVLPPLARHVDLWRDGSALRSARFIASFAVSSPPSPYVSSSLSPVEASTCPQGGSAATKYLPPSPRASAVPCRPWRHRRRLQTSCPPASHRLRLFSRRRRSRPTSRRPCCLTPVRDLGLWFLTDEHIVTH